jgi:hypothetical protein
VHSPAQKREMHSSSSPRRASRYDRRFYLTGALVLGAAVTAKAVEADDFHAYPTIAVGLGPATLALAALLVLSGLTPLRRKPRRRRV